MLQAAQCNAATCLGCQDSHPGHFLPAALIHNEVVAGSGNPKNADVGDTREFEYIESVIEGEEDDKPNEEAEALFRFQSTIKEEIHIDLKDNENEVEKYLKY